MKSWSPKTFEKKVCKEAVDYMALHTCMKPKIINDFIVKNNLNAQKIVEDFDIKWHRHDLVTAIIGKPNNHYALSIINKYKKNYSP